MKPTGDDKQTIRIEISQQSFANIIEKHAVSIADIHCLDTTSKQQLRQLYLQSCLTD